MLQQSERPSAPELFNSVIKATRAVLVSHIAGHPYVKKHLSGPESLVSGKMLRTRFAARLFAAADRSSDFELIKLACAAVECAHAATLLHDDVIDMAAVRRGLPAVWKTLGQNGSILMGDLLFCQASSFMITADNGYHGRYLNNFYGKMHEVCSAEIEQELELRGKVLDQETCIRIAARKTGPLFAFLGFVSGGRDDAASRALETAGYHIGTAYQLADDLLDSIGREETARKTLGTDAKRKKYTLPSGSDEDVEKILQLVSHYTELAAQSAQPWPDLHNGLSEFIACDFKPTLDKHLVSVS